MKLFGWEQKKLKNSSKIKRTSYYMKRITRKLIALTAFFMLLNCDPEEESEEKEHKEYVKPNKKLPKAEEDPTEEDKLSEAEKKKIESFCDISSLKTQANNNPQKVFELFTKKVESKFVREEIDEDQKSYLFKYALEQGIDINKQNQHGDTFLLLAVINNVNKETLEAIIKKGAKTDIGDDVNGLTPLHFAAVSKSNPCDKINLFATKDNINIKDAHGRTPLMFAVQNKICSPEVYELLLSQGANIDEKNNSGSTPLHLAVWYQSLDLVKILVSLKADINAKDSANRTPLDLAKKLEDGDKGVDIKKYLESCANQ